MTDRPLIGEPVFMDSMSEDVNIMIYEVPEKQPLVDSDGFYIIVDQYGDEHLIELDKDSWITGNVNALSSKGLEIWLEHSQEKLAKNTADQAILQPK